MKGNINFKIIDNISDFFNLKEKWITLYDNLENKEIFYEWIWIEGYVKTFKTDSFKPFVVVGEDKGKIVAIAPLCIEELKVGLVKKRVLKFIIDTTADYQCILIRKDYNHYSVLRRVFNKIFNCESWDLICLNNISYREKQASLIMEVINNFEKDGICYRKINKIAPYIILNEFDDKKSPKRYKTINKKEKAIDKNENVSINIDCKWNEGIWNQFVEIHISKWEDSVFKNDKYVKFYEELFKKIYEEGKLEFSYVLYDNKVISGHIGFKCYNKIFGYNIYNNEKAKTLLMGEILTKKIVEYYKEEYDMYDTLLGNEEYKFYSTDASINICDYTIIRKNQLMLRFAKKVRLLFFSNR